MVVEYVCGSTESVQIAVHTYLALRQSSAVATPKLGRCLYCDAECRSKQQQRWQTQQCGEKPFLRHSVSLVKSNQLPGQAWDNLEE
jgi:hypothetical protein